MSKHRHTHIVPRSHIAMFAEDGKVECHFVRTGDSRLIGPRNVAVRTDMYTERRPDGGISTAFEEALGPLESKAVPLMRELEQLWPLSDADRGTFAEYLALQLIRTPAYRAFFERAREASLAQRSAELETEEQRRALRELSGSDRFRLDLMLRQIAKGATVMGSL